MKRLTITALLTMTACGSDGTDPGVDAAPTAPPFNSVVDCAEFSAPAYARIEPDRRCFIDLNFTGVIIPPQFIPGQRSDGSVGSESLSANGDGTYYVNGVRWRNTDGKAARASDGCHWFQCDY